MEVVADYELTILDELDLRREAANASQLRRNFEGSDLVYVPQVHWDYTRSNVMVAERISGIPVTDMAALEACGTDLKLLAERGVEIFFTQVFRDNFFHADMHPGNIFVNATDPANPRYIAVDCAIVGSLSDADQYYLARNLLAVFQRDYRAVAELHVECGWIPPDTRVQDFESAMRAVCEPVFERPISDISFGQLLIYLFSTARRFDMEVQPALVLLQKTLSTLRAWVASSTPSLICGTPHSPFSSAGCRSAIATVHAAAPAATLPLLAGAVARRCRMPCSTTCSAGPARPISRVSNASNSSAGWPCSARNSAGHRGVTSRPRHSPSAGWYWRCPGMGLPHHGARRQLAIARGIPAAALAGAQRGRIGGLMPLCHNASLWTP